MKETKEDPKLVGRRGELIAELFLQDLKPVFLARATPDLGYDFLIGFDNPRKGFNITGVEVKATSHPVPTSFPLQKRLYERLANSNIPGLLLVADVKRNKLFYAWPTMGRPNGGEGSSKVTIPVIPVDEQTAAQLRSRLVG